MNWMDVVIIAVLGISIILGMKRGLIKSLVPLVGVTLGVIFAGMFHHSLAGALGFIQNESLAGIIAFALILIAVCVLTIILGKMLRGMIQMVFLGWVDRLAGGAFGFVVGWIICSVIVVLLARYVALPAEIPDMPIPELDQWIEDWRGLEEGRMSLTTAISESRLATAQIDSFPVILGVLPERFDVVRDFFDK